MKVGTGPTIKKVHQRLEITLPSGSKNGSDSTFQDTFLIGYTSTCMLKGDFDIQARYSLPKYPDFNGVRLGFEIPGVAVIERDSLSHNDSPSGDFYHEAGVGNDFIPTSDKHGTLRFTRTGSTLVSYYFNAQSKIWVNIYSSSVTADDVSFAMRAWSHESVFSGQPVVVAFDNVIINKGTLVGAACSN